MPKDREITEGTKKERIEQTNKAIIDKCLSAVADGSGDDFSKLVDVLMLNTMQLAKLTDVLYDLAYKTEVERRSARMTTEKEV